MQNGSFSEKVREVCAMKGEGMDEIVSTLREKSGLPVFFSSSVSGVGTDAVAIETIFLGVGANAVSCTGWSMLSDGKVEEARTLARLNALQNLFLVLDTAKVAGKKADKAKPELPVLTTDNPNWNQIVAKAKEIANAQMVYEQLSKCFSIEAGTLYRLLSEAGLS